ncbi:MAG: hypothetical protein NXH97_00315 [Rhodobacteraceae bacterium]|nr:hypothetical protein [Paracoccaceae bacterium]
MTKIINVFEQKIYSDVNWEEVQEWLEKDLQSFSLDEVAIVVAQKFNSGECSFMAADSFMNAFYWHYLESCKFQPAGIFFDVYLAFDAGEFHRKSDRTDDPVQDHTKPQIQEILGRLK